MPEELMIVLIVGMVVGIPVLGLTIRLVAKPMAEAFTTLKDSFTGPQGISMGDQRLMRLEDEVDALRKTVAMLEEAEEFRKALDRPKRGADALSSGPSEG